jgi:hypothetical protein
VGSLVVFPSLLGVGEDFVDLLNLLEALLGAGVIRVSIRVVLSDQPPVSLPDLVPGGTPGYPEQLVKILTLPDFRSLFRSLRIGVLVSSRTSC